MDRQFKKASIIVPVYKTEKYVKKTVESILNQTYKNVEIILVDDGSPDSAPIICDNLAAQFPNIKVIHKENGGLSSARNEGILHMDQNSQFVFFLDSDDTILPNAMESMIKLAEETNADVVMPNKYLSFNEEDEEKIKEALLFPASLCYETPKEFVLHTIMENCRGWRATGILYSTNIIREANCLFPIGKISEDVIFNLNFLVKAEKIVFYSNPTIKVLKREGSITHTFQNGFEETIYYIDEQSKVFLENAGLSLDENQKYLDAMLCRNLVVFLFSIMSSKNSMALQLKKEYAKKVLTDERNRKVFRIKQPTPWFESKKIKLGMQIIYMLLRLKLDGIAVWLLSFFA